MPEDAHVLYYLGLWARRQQRIGQQLALHTQAANHDRHLLAVAQFIEAGELSKGEVLRFLANVPQPQAVTASEPWVITFGTNVTDLLAAKRLPPEASATYLTACDWLEKDLAYQVACALPVLAQQSEASARNGETLSMRFAFWNLDLDRLDAAEFPPWSILEIAPFSAIYDQSADDLLARAVARAHAALVSDPWDTVFGVGRCPRCGSQKLDRFSATDHERDDTYHTIRCIECGWFEWTQ